MANFTFPEFDTYIAPDETEFNLEGNFKFTDFQDGYGFPPMEMITSRGPTQHGETIIDYRLRPRVIQMVYNQKTESRFDYWTARANLMDILRPNRHAIDNFGPGILRKYLPDGTQRDINVILEQGPIFTARRGIDVFTIQDTIRFIGHDPTFFNPDEETSVWILTTSDSLVFPFAFDGSDLQFSTDVIDNDIVITYEGTWPTFPTITIEGPLVGPLITNVSTGKFLSLNYSLVLGETVVIDLPYGNKTVISDINGNLMGYMTSDSNLVDFSIDPNPQVAGGLNTINIVGGGALLGTSSVTLDYFTRYIGI